MNTPRYQHVRFHALKTGENFFHGKLHCYKTSCVTCRAYIDGELFFFSPWRKVRSTRPFGKVVPPIFPLELETLTGEGPTVRIVFRETRPPVAVTPGGDRTPETIGGNELTPSA